MIWLLLGGVIWAGALSAIHRLTGVVVEWRVERRETLRLEEEVKAVAAQAERDKASAELERREAAWLLSQAKRTQAREPSRDDRIEYVSTLSRYADWSKIKS